MIPYNNEEQHEHEKVFLSFIKDFLAQLSAKKIQMRLSFLPTIGLMCTNIKMGVGTELNMI